MKVLHVYKTYFPEDFTGVPRVIHAIAEGTAGLGVDSQVLTLTRGPASSDPIKVGRHQVHQIKRDFQLASSDFAVQAFGAFSRLVSSADVVNYHLPWPTADLLWLHAGRKYPSVVTYHSDVVKQRHLLRLYEPLMHRFLNGADVVVATSPNYLRSSAVLRRHSEKTTVIPIGIEPRRAVDPDLRSQWQTRVGKGFFLFVGAARYYKGIAFLIEAARQTGLQVVLAGDHGDISISELPQNVVAIGPVTDEDKEALLDLSCAFVFPSHLRSEAFGVALLEGARAAKPLISCEIGTGTSFVNLDGVTGLVVSPQSSAELAEAMKQLATNGTAAATMGMNAYNRFQQLFTRDRMAQEYAAIYKRAVDTHRI